MGSTSYEIKHILSVQNLFIKPQICCYWSFPKWLTVTIKIYLVWVRNHVKLGLKFGVIYTIVEQWNMRFHFCYIFQFKLVAIEAKGKKSTHALKMSDCIYKRHFLYKQLKIKHTLMSVLVFIYLMVICHDWLEEYKVLPQ